jgi:hypothetical protein
MSRALIPSTASRGEHVSRRIDASQRDVGQGDGDRLRSAGLPDGPDRSRQRPRFARRLSHEASGLMTSCTSVTRRRFCAEWFRSRRVRSGRLRRSATPAKTAIVTFVLRFVRHPPRNPDQAATQERGPARDRRSAVRRQQRTARESPGAGRWRRRAESRRCISKARRPRPRVWRDEQVPTRSQVASRFCVYAGAQRLRRHNSRVGRHDSPTYEHTAYEGDACAAVSATWPAGQGRRRLR